jgi:hypothetical protein
VHPQLGLNVLGALYRMDHGREVYQEGIADGLDDRPVMLGDCVLNDLIMDTQQPQHAGFVAAHLPAEADDVGKHDRGELAGFDLRGTIHTFSSNGTSSS